MVDVIFGKLQQNQNSDDADDEALCKMYSKDHKSV